MLKNLKKIQLFRHLVQLVSFFLFPGIFILAFGELKYIYQSLIKGNLNFFQTMSVSIELILVVLFTIILGRFFCGWICAFGTLNDFIYTISKKVFKTKFRINQKLDSKLKYLKYVVLVSVIAFSWTVGYSFFEYSSPWEAFAQITDFSNVLSNLTIGLILLLLIAVGAFFIERFFCRYLCPLGAIFTIISKFSIFNIDMPKYDCGNRSCKACTNNCSMGIALNNRNEITGGECINCLNCIEICPSKNAKATIVNIPLSRTLAASIALAAVIGFYAFYNIGTAASASAVSDSSTKYEVSSNNNEVNANQDDGIIYDNNASTSTTLPNSSDSNSIENSNSNNEINSTITPSTTQDPETNSSGIDTDTVSNNSNYNGNNSNGSGSGTNSSSSNTSNSTNSTTKSSSNTAASTKASTNTNTNTNTTTATTSKPSTTTKSNTSSGSTSSSKASTSTKPSSGTNASSSTSTTTNSSSSNSTSSSSNTTKTLKYKNGTYSGSGIGFRGGTTTVSVTISNDKIINLETTYSEDTPRFYERVEYMMFEQIISSQSTSVDIVSGATYSCDGITAAVEDALSKALANN